MPVVIDNGLDHISLDALDRNYFIAKHGKEAVALVDCEGHRDVRGATLGDFLSKFAGPQSPTAPIQKVKVRVVYPVNNRSIT